MGARSGLALKSVQWFVRGIQFCCAVVVLGIFSYFLATLHNHSLNIDTWIRAVEGISGAAVVYTLLGLLLLCCLAGHPLTAFIAIVLDLAFCGAFIYVAWANRGGANSCNGFVYTPFGNGDANRDGVVQGTDGFTALPSLRTACRLQTAAMAVSIIAIVFFLISALLEVALGRHRQKEKRFGPSPANDYTSGYPKRRGIMGFLNRKKRGNAAYGENPNALPAHTHPDQVRASYATDNTRVGTATHDPLGYPKHGEAGLDNAPAAPAHGHIAPGYRPAQYDDGVYDTRRA